MFLGGGQQGGFGGQVYNQGGYHNQQGYNQGGYGNQGGYADQGYNQGGYGNQGKNITFRVRKRIYNLLTFNSLSKLFFLI